VTLFDLPLVFIAVTGSLQAIVFGSKNGLADGASMSAGLLSKFLNSRLTSIMVMEVTQL
jgi:hypothetical protein